MQSLILAVWVEGEAADRGITVTQEDIDAELEQIKSQSFNSEKRVQQVRQAVQVHAKRTSRSRSS